MGIFGHFSRSIFVRSDKTAWIHFALIHPKGAEFFQAQFFIHVFMDLALYTVMLEQDECSYLVKVYNTLHPLYYLPVISFVYVRLYPNETWLTEFLPSSDEVDKCILWLHFERQQGHLEDWEKVKGKWEKISREPREVTDRLTANIIHLLDWWITPAMSHPHETCDSCWHDTLTSLTVPELMYFFFLPFFLGFNTLTIREETWNKLFNKQVRTHYIVFPHISKLIWTGGDLILSSNKGWNS